MITMKVRIPDKYEIQRHRHQLRLFVTVVAAKYAAGQNFAAKTFC